MNLISAHRAQEILTRVCQVLPTAHGKVSVEGLVDTVSKALINSAKNEQQAAEFIESLAEKNFTLPQPEDLGPTPTQSQPGAGPAGAPDKEPTDEPTGDLDISAGFKLGVG